MNRLLLLPLFAICLFLYTFSSWAIRHVRTRIKTRQHHAGYAPVVPASFLGVPLFREMIRSRNSQTFPIHQQSIQEFMSRRLGRFAATYRFAILGNDDIYMTSDPRIIQAVLANQFEDFDIGSNRRGALLPGFGDGIFVQDGKAWEHSRALIRPSFVKDQVSDLDIEERHVKSLVKVMTSSMEQGWTDMIDLQPLFFRLTIDSATEFLFGESVESQITESLQNTSTEQAFSHHFDLLQAHLGFRLLIGPFYYLWFPYPILAHIKVVDAFISRYVKLALEKGTTKTQHEPKRYVFLEELATRTQDPVELKAQLLNILLAGRDTTASLLSWFFYAMLRHPDVFEKLRKTVIDAFGTYENSRIDYNNLKDCRYLRYCLNEALRLWPIVPFNTRMANKWTTLPHGGGPDGESPVVLSPGSEVNYSVYLMQRRKDIYGEDAEEFKPERWESRRPGWTYLPFNGGPRICPGQTLALTNASYVVVRMLQKFDKIEAPAQDLHAPIQHKMYLTDSPGRPVRMKLHVAAE